MINVERVKRICGFRTEKEFFSVNVTNTTNAPRQVSLFNIITNFVDPFYGYDPSSVPPAGVTADGALIYLGLVNELANNAYLIHCALLQGIVPDGAAYSLTPIDYGTIAVVSIDANGKQQTEPFYSSIFVDPYQYQPNQVFFNCSASPILLDGRTSLDFLLNVYGTPVMGIYPTQPTFKFVMWYDRVLRSDEPMIKKLKTIPKSEGLVNDWALGYSDLIK